MPRFMVTRTLPPLNDTQLKEVARNVQKACKEMGNVTWIRSHITSDGGHSFCELEAGDASQCREHAKRAGLPVDDVVPLSGEIGPVPNI
jgi:hypothetical protein